MFLNIQIENFNFIIITIIIINRYMKFLSYADIHLFKNPVKCNINQIFLFMF